MGGAVDGVTNTWLLVRPAVASVVTFLIVLSPQHTQNRDSELVKLERLWDEELTEIADEIVRLRQDALQDRCLSAARTLTVR